jgi:hypothetical protein
VSSGQNVLRIWDVLMRNDGIMGLGYGMKALWDVL